MIGDCRIYHLMMLLGLKEQLLLLILVLEVVTMPNYQERIICISGADNCCSQGSDRIIATVNIDGETRYKG